MLSATTKGLLVGLANLVVVAFLIGVEEGVRFLPQILVVVSVLGAGPALGIGALCGWLGGRLAMLRRVTLITISMVTVTTLGLLSDALYLIRDVSLIEVFPTFIAALTLELWTRPNLATQTPKPMSPTLVGLLLGLANVAVVAIVLAIYVTHVEPRHLVAGISIHPPFGLHFVALVLCLGVIPAAGVGALAGFLASKLSDHHLVTRLTGIGSVAVCGVFALGSLTDAPILVVPALLPTLFGVGVLERLTRPIEAVPGARVLRGA
jgi:hypothetical protein